MVRTRNAGKTARNGKKIGVAQKTIKKTKPSSVNKIYKYKKMIEILKNHSDFVENLQRFYPNERFSEKEVTNHAVIALEKMYKAPVKRFEVPAVYTFFDSGRQEVELNLMMRHGVVQRQKDKEMLQRHGITQELEINLLENNELFDWSYIGVYGCNDDDAIRVFGQTRAHESVQSYVRKRNKAAILLKKIQEENKVKLIKKDQLTYDIVLYFSNYFELMFKFLTEDDLQSDKTQYYGCYYENWFADEKEVRSVIQRSDKYLAARAEWQLNDGWKVVENDKDLFKQRFLYFIKESNVKALVGNNLQSHLYKDWLEGNPHEDLVFKSTLTYDKFKTTNIPQIVHDILDIRFRKMSKGIFERAMRTIYNKEIVNAANLHENIKFLDGTSRTFWYMPKNIDRVNEYEEFSVAEEKEFMEKYEEEKLLRRYRSDDEESVQEIENSQNNEVVNVHSDGFLERITEIIRDCLGTQENIKTEKNMNRSDILYQVAINSNDDESSSSEEPDLNGCNLIHLEDLQSSIDSTLQILNASQIEVASNEIIQQVEASSEENFNTALRLYCSPDCCHTAKTSTSVDAPLQVHEIHSNGNNGSPIPNNQSPETPTNSSSVPFNATLSDNVQTVIRRPQTRAHAIQILQSETPVIRKRRSYIPLRRLTLQHLTDEIIDVNPDSPIVNALRSASATKTPSRKSPRLAMRIEENNQQMSPRTRTQTRYLSTEETLERATFNAMTPTNR